GNYIDFGDETVSDILHSVAKSFAVYGVDKVTAFDITNLSGIIITYDNHIDINIGLPDDIEYKIKTAFTIINEKLDPNQTGTVAGTLDVSTCNKNKMSRYKPSPTMPAPVPTLPQPTTAPSDSGGNGGAGTYTYNDNLNGANNGTAGGNADGINNNAGGVSDNANTGEYGQAATYYPQAQ
ncbi:MAG: hypothetical protein II012_00720, partial [Ruminococcus sp.]|nr:hypothetical protein [Ruminococcus sp.]